MCFHTRGRCSCFQCMSWTTGLFFENVECTSTIVMRANTLIAIKLYLRRIILRYSILEKHTFYSDKEARHREERLWSFSHNVAVYLKLLDSSVTRQQAPHVPRSPALGGSRRVRSLNLNFLGFAIHILPDTCVPLICSKQSQLLEVA